jgi:hypothetical protein
MGAPDPKCSNICIVQKSNDDNGEPSSRVGSLLGPIGGLKMLDAHDV